MVIIQNFLKSMEVLFSVEYIIPPLIIDGVLMVLLCSMSYICVLLHWQSSIAYKTHQNTSMCFICIIPPFSLSEWPTDVPRPCKIFVIFNVLSLPPLRQIGVTLFFGGGGLITLLHLRMNILWHQTTPPLIFVIIVGPFYTIPIIIVQEITPPPIILHLFKDKFFAN